LVILAGLSASIGSPALAQGGGPEIQQQLEEKDARIRDLERRVEMLERLVGAGPQPTTAPAPAGPPPASEAQAAEAPVEPPPASETQAAEASAEPAPPGGSEEEPSGPGSFEVDPAAAERALERTLVLTGTLLLPPGRIDVEPFFSYEYNDRDFDRTLAQLRDNDTWTAGVNLRLGLPFDSQVELGIPYIVARDVDDPFFGGGGDSFGHGFGDLRLGLAKTLLRESGPIPDLVARVTWDTNTGDDSDNGVGLDSGFNELGFSLNALKRQDPLAFVVSVGYEYAFENDDQRPGDTFALGLAALLAASPETSLRLAFSAAYSGDQEFEGRTFNGTDQNAATLSFGVSSVLGRGVLLNVDVGAGLTDDAPDYFVTVSLPFRLNLW
jgi:hypothetical protein